MDIKNYRPINKGCLQACFDVFIDEWGMTIRDCCLFEKEGRKWINLPSRQYQSKEGTTKNFDYIVFEKERKERFQKACLEKISSGQVQQTVKETNEVLPF